MPRKSKKSKDQKTIKKLIISQIILFLIVIVGGAFTYGFIDVFRKEHDYASTHRISNLLEDGLEGVTRPAPHSRQQSIPEMSLVFDLSSQDQLLEYRYHEAFEDEPAYAVVTSTDLKSFAQDELNKSSNNTFQGLFEGGAVARAQNCGRPYIISMSNESSFEDDEYVMSQSISLSSESQLYVWKTTKTLCQGGNEDRLKEIEDVLQTARVN